MTKIALVTVACIQASAALADTPDAFQFYKEEAMVVTASRRPQSISDIPMAVDVVTLEEIKASGATNLWDLLRFRTGMDVLDGRSFVDGNRAVVSVRGFPQLFAANLLVLIDGRSAYSSQNNGTYWDELPVQMQDIQRIEIIRGPNTALYGTGAALGVINIITKKPEGKTQASVDTKGGSLGLFQSSESLDSGIGKAAVRASYTYRTQNGYPQSANGQEGNDFLNKHVGNIRTEWRLTQKSDLEFFAGGSSSNVGVPAAGNPRADFDSHFQMMKYSHEGPADSTVEISGSRNDTTIDVAPYAGGTNHLRALQYDADILHRFELWDKRLSTTYGTSFRHAGVESVQQYPGDHAPYVELYRGYLHQTFKPLARLSLQGAVAVEGSNLSGLEPSYQAAAILSPIRDHAFRLSYSESHTVPDLFPLFADYRTTPTTRLVGNPTLPPYRVRSYEVGYHGAYVDNHLHVDSSLFYTQVDNFHAIHLRSITFAPLQTTLGFDNDDNAIARGAEMQFKYGFSSSRWIYLNYTFEHISDIKNDTALRTRNTPAHKVNLGGAASLGRGFSASVNAGYKDGYLIAAENSGAVALAVPAYWRVDAKVAYTLPWYRNAELYIAGQNLAVSNHVEFPDGLTVPRTYQGGMTIKFGPKAEET